MMYASVKRSFTILAILSVAILCVGVCQAQKQNPNPGKDDVAATFNMSYPMIATDIIEVLYEKDPVYEGDEIVDWVLAYDEFGDPIPIEVTESITALYGGPFEGWENEVYTTYVVDEVTGCGVDEDSDGYPDMTEPIPMLTWIDDNGPWYSQPATTSSDDPNLLWNAAYVDPPNTWQSDWVMATEVQQIDFIDWGNPLENNDPIVGQRFPVEIALFKILETPMNAYKVACVTLPASRDEIFGTSRMGGADYTKPWMLATVMTNNFFAEVEKPDGTRTSIDLAPGMGPSGKMNFASASGGWIPDMPGVHRIWLHINDPLITLVGSIVNNDEHYAGDTGCMLDELSQHKQDMSGIIGNSTYIDVDVQRPSGKKK